MSYQKEGRGNLRKQYVCMYIAPGREEKRCLQEYLPLARSIRKHDHCKYSLKLRITHLESYKLPRSRVACPVAIPASPSGSPKCGHHSCPRRLLLCAVWFCTTTEQTTQKHGIPGIDTADANLVKSQGTKRMPYALMQPVKSPSKTTGKRQSARNS